MGFSPVNLGQSLGRWAIAALLELKSGRVKQYMFVREKNTVRSNPMPQSPTVSLNTDSSIVHANNRVSSSRAGYNYDRNGNVLSD